MRRCCRWMSTSFTACTRRTTLAALTRGGFAQRSANGDAVHDSIDQPAARRRRQESCVRKKRYFDELSALIGAVRTEPYAEVPIFTYRCRTCDGWHLSRQPQR